MPNYTVFFGNEQSSEELSTQIKRDVVSNICALNHKVLEAGWMSPVAFRDAFRSASYDWENPFTVKASPEAAKYFIIAPAVPAVEKPAVENPKKRGRLANAANEEQVQEPPRRSKFDSVFMPAPFPEVLGANVAISRMLQKASSLAISTAEQCTAEYKRLCSTGAEADLDKLPEWTHRFKMCSAQYDSALRDISSAIVSGEDRPPLFNIRSLRSFSLDDKLCDQYAQTAAAEVILGIAHHEPGDILELLRYMMSNEDELTHHRINQFLICLDKETKRRLFTRSFYRFLEYNADSLDLSSKVTENVYTARDPMDEIHAAHIRLWYSDVRCIYTAMNINDYTHEQIADFALQRMDQTADDESIFKGVVKFLTPEDNVRDDSYQRMLEAQDARFPDNMELRNTIAKYIRTLPTRTECV